MVEYQIVQVHKPLVRWSIFPHKYRANFLPCALHLHVIRMSTVEKRGWGHRCFQGSSREWYILGELGLPVAHWLVKITTGIWLHAYFGCYSAAGTHLEHSEPGIRKSVKVDRYETKPSGSDRLEKIFNSKEQPILRLDHAKMPDAVLLRAKLVLIGFGHVNGFRLYNCHGCRCVGNMAP